MWFNNRNRILNYLVGARCTQNLMFSFFLVLLNHQNKIHIIILKNLYRLFLYDSQTARFDDAFEVSYLSLGISTGDRKQLLYPGLAMAGMMICVESMTPSRRKKKKNKHFKI